MNKILKRSVATLLTAGMLLTGLTACNKTPEERAEESLLSAFNKDTNIEFEKITGSTLSIVNKEYIMYIYGYDKQSENIEDTEMHHIYKEAKYIITETEFNEFKSLNNNDYDAFYPFSTDVSKFLHGIIKKYNPEYTDEASITPSAKNAFDDIVETYCKE